MAEITRREPIRELRDELDRIFRHFTGSVLSAEDDDVAGAWSPVLDIEESDEAFDLHLELPGVKPEDVEVSIDEGVLTIRGERRFYEEKEAEGFRRVERRFGRFYRALRLPSNVKADDIRATYEDGLLHITVPKAEEAKPHRIPVKAS
jgi:HSP20 family protein